MKIFKNKISFTEEDQIKKTIINQLPKHYQIKMQELIEKLDSLENTNDQSEITLRAELFAIEKDLPPVNVMFLYNVINKIGELSDRAEQVGHRISLIASR